MSQQPHILVVDDEPGILLSLGKVLEREAYRVSCTDSGHDAVELLRREHVDVVLADIMMPKMSGMDLLRTARAMAPATEVVMMTAYGTVESAVACMREGAYDFITKPLKRALVVRSVQRALERRALLRENLVLRAVADQGAAATTGSDIVGQSAALRATLAMVAQAAPSLATILLVGESGTGKELLARHVHSLSERAHGPFVAVNCAALPESLLESELFGHEKGAFTGATGRREGRFARAHGGTLFLDEVGELSPAVQVRLLRVLQAGEIERVGADVVLPVDVRVVVATHRSLEEAVRAGAFREDLFYRLNVIQVRVPPLRERHGDVVLLAHYFLHRFAAKNHKNVRGFAEGALKALDAHPWPGNVRELENAVERAVVLCRNEMIGVDDLPTAITASGGGDGAARATALEGIFVPFGTTLAEIERRVIQATLERTGGDKKTAAHLLGIAARTIYRKIDAV